LTADYAAAINESLLNLTATATDSRLILNPSPCVRARLFLPIRLNGCGLQSNVKRHSTEYLGGIHQGLCALLDRRHIRILNDETSSTTKIASTETLLNKAIGMLDVLEPAIIFLLVKRV
jgi:hypothetical protein